MIGRTIPVGSKTYRAFGEYNYASGDDTPGRRRCAARSISSIRRRTTSTGSPIRSAGRTFTICGRASRSRPHAKLALAGSYHSFWLASATDALYSAGGAVLARIPTGAPDRHVGQELDIQATYTPSPRIQLHGGYAHIFTGAFLKAATPGKSYSAPYVMVTTMLLGLEK